MCIIWHYKVIQLYNKTISLFRSVFGPKRLQKRLSSESSESEGELEKGSLKRKHSEVSGDVKTATDVLVEVSTQC